MTDSAAPKFWVTFAEALGVSAQKRGIFAYVPWFLIIVIMLSIFGGRVFQVYRPLVSFEASDITTALAAMMVVGGFLGAVSIACMSQIYGTLGDKDFSSYLQAEKIFDQFLFWPQFNLLVQISFVLLSALGIFVSYAMLDGASQVYLLSVGSGLMFYVTTKTWALVDLMRLLLWHRQDYVRLRDEVEAE